MSLVQDVASEIVSNAPKSTSLQRFERQLGGHSKLLAINGGSTIVKPCNEIERDFYELSIIHPDFARWMPKYYGYLQLQGFNSSLLERQEECAGEEKTARTVSASRDPRVFGENREQNTNISGIEEAICIENLLSNFKKPCIMDVKIGKQLWGEDASEEKKRKMIRKAELTTSGPLGLALIASQVFKKSSDSYINYDRAYCRSLTADTVSSGFSNFFDADIPAKLRRSVIERFVEDLELLIKVLKNQEMRLFSASLLFVYEGDPDTLLESLEYSQDKDKDVEEEDRDGEDEEDEEDEGDEEDEEDDEPEEFKATDLRFIDFAHSYFRKGVGEDENSLFGLNNTLKILRQLLDETAKCN